MNSSPQYVPTPAHGFEEKYDAMALDDKQVVPFSIIKEIMPDEYPSIRAKLEESNQYKLYCNQFQPLEFGKHRGSTLLDLVTLDPQYVKWLSGPNAWIERNHPMVQRQAKLLLNLQ